MKKITLITIFIMLAFSPVRAVTTPPMLGVNYNYTGLTFHDTAMFEGYDADRELAQSQLSAMCANGARSVRFMVRFRTESEGIGSIFVPSAGGVMPEPYRQRFIDILTDFKNSCLQKVVIAFVPTVSNDPMQSFGTDLAHTYNPDKFAENWAFMQDVRSLTKEYGPPSEFDLINEGAPWDTLPAGIKSQLITYDYLMIQAYNNAYGFTDACISFMARDASTLARMLDIHFALNIFPSKWCMTAYPANPTALNYFNMLKRIDTTLRNAGKNQPLAIYETYYNNHNVALAVDYFIGHSTRGVSDLIEWPILTDLQTLVPPPFYLSEYLTIQ